MDNKRTLEERFDNTFDLDHFGNSHIVNDKVKQFIRSELTSLLRQLEEKKQIESYENNVIGQEDREYHFVSLEDIQAVFKEWGVE